MESGNLTGREINFQGQRMYLENILPADSSALENELKSINEIGKALEFEDLRIHIERKFVPLTGVKNESPQSYSNALNSEELLDSVTGKKVVILSDDRGEGKTTELRLLAKLLKQKQPTHWISFIDLTDYAEAFATPNDFESPSNIAEFLCEKFLKINGLEAKVFTNLFNQGRVIVFMDGFDEISSTFMQLVVKLSNEVSEKTDNQMWIAARPQTERSLIEKLGGMIFKLRPLTHVDQTTFVETLIGKDENYVERIREVSNFLFTLNSYRSSKVNPVILRVAMEVLGENSEIKVKQSNFQPLFSCFVDIMMRKFLRKPQTKEILADDILIFHRKHALLIVFEKTAAEYIKMIENQFETLNLPSIKQMTKVGFVSSNGSEIIRFHDLTLAEYFVAGFFYEKVFLFDCQVDSEVAKLFRALWNKNGQYSCRMVTKFLDSIFETASAEGIGKIQATFVRLLPEKELQEVFRLAVFDDCLNLIQIISLIFKNQQEALFEMWMVRQFGTNALMMAIESHQIDYVERMMSIAHEVLAPEYFKKLFLDKGGIGSASNIYFGAASGFGAGALTFLMTHKLNPLSEEESRQLLTARDNRGFNILTKSCEMSTDLRELQVIIEIVKEKCGADELKKMMSEVDGSGKSLLLHALPSIRKPETFVWLSQKFKDNFSLEELREIFLGVASSEDAKFSLIHIAIKWSGAVFKTFFNFFEEVLPEKSEQKEFLATAFHGHVTLFHYATENGDVEAFRLIKSKYELLFSKEELKKMIVMEYFSIFYLAIQGYDNEATIELLWNFMQQLIDIETLKEILLRKEQNQKFPEMFWQNEKRFHNIVAIFDSFIEEHCTEEEAKAFREIPPPSKRFNPLARFWS